jgi:pimeloyl-ACP methyl ester carboxylesterase
VTPEWHTLERSGCRLRAVDYGGNDRPVLLLHGLAGHAREWDETASWLATGHRVVALDQRGHGQSERSPSDVSRAAFVDDAEAWIEELDLAPVVLIGQSLGAHTAFLTAARRPDLVGALVVAEATPQADPGAPASVGSWLGGWPVPFASHSDAIAYFGGDSLWAQAWTAGLEQADDGLRPAFEISVMVAALEESSRVSYWDEWGQIRCPTLIVRAKGGEGCPAIYERMNRSLPGSRLVEISDAGHDVHLDQPAHWRAAVEDFLG